MDVLEYKNGKKAEVALTIQGKPASVCRKPIGCLSIRMISFPSWRKSRWACRFIRCGGKRESASSTEFDRYVDLVTSSGTVRIWSEAAFLVNVGEAKGINYSLKYPAKEGGIHFNLSNNLWNTNFCMWNEGSLTYRFTIEQID